MEDIFSSAQLKSSGLILFFPPTQFCPILPETRSISQMENAICPIFKWKMAAIKNRHVWLIRTRSDIIKSNYDSRQNNEREIAKVT